MSDTPVRPVITVAAREVDYAKLLADGFRCERWKDPIGGKFAAGTWSVRYFQRLRAWHKGDVSFYEAGSVRIELYLGDHEILGVTCLPNQKISDGIFALGRSSTGEEPWDRPEMWRFALLVSELRDDMYPKSLVRPDRVLERSSEPFAQMIVLCESARLSS